MKGDISRSSRLRRIRTPWKLVSREVAARARPSGFRDGENVSRTTVEPVGKLVGRRETV